MAIGKPVALEARAEDLETRGFISMTMILPVAGSTANWMLQPPVSTPTSRMTAMPMCGECKYGKGTWKEDGICYACREQVWIPGAPHRKAGEEG